MTKAYIDFIYNKCFIDITNSPHNTIFLVEMPNGYCFSVSAIDEEGCVALTKIKIEELESYLERDKSRYGYDLEGEYE